MQWAAGEGKDIELRHQRNPDVLFDSVRQEEGTTPHMNHISQDGLMC